VKSNTNTRFRGDDLVQQSFYCMKTDLVSLKHHDAACQESRDWISFPKRAIEPEKSNSMEVGHEN